MDIVAPELNVTRVNTFNYFKDVSRLFYIMDPNEHVFRSEEEVPNYYIQSWPYFLMFMMVEHIILKLEGRKGIRVNDGITSLSNAIFLQCGMLVWRGAESFFYTWLYTKYRLIDLAWDSTFTWILAAIGIDFCYYWMHRACHEVHILWAQHQVHHTSEDFNTGVGLRQSMLQGWCGFIFYLPLALAIPPAQFVMHHQFSYMYMFWIHTEAIRNLGPLEYVLNTPSHHRIHHGSNPYCIDANYGGVLIIWDKLFGTFRAEQKTDKIVYGLIFNQPSFNPLHLQTFYTRKVISKFQKYDNWAHKFHAVFNRTSWQPGTFKRFKDVKEDPKAYERVKYDVLLPRWCSFYILSHYTFVLYGFYQLFLAHVGMSPLSVLLFAIYILGSLTVFGMMLDASTKAPLLEMTRCFTTLLLARWLAPSFGLLMPPYLQMFFALSGLFWMLIVFNTVEIKAEKKGI